MPFINFTNVATMLLMIEEANSIGTSKETKALMVVTMWIVFLIIYDKMNWEQYQIFTEEMH